jgi:hypothetical protein
MSFFVNNKNMIPPLIFTGVPFRCAAATGRAETVHPWKSKQDDVRPKGRT